MDVSLKTTTLLLFIIADPTAVDSDAFEGNCSHGALSTEGELLFDKAMKKYLTSESLREVAIPAFNNTARVAKFNLFMQFSNGTITGLSSVRRLGSNYFEALEDHKLRIRLGVQLDGLNVSIVIRIKALFFHVPIQVEVFVPAIRFIAEIETSDNMLHPTHFELNNTERFGLRFRVLGGALRMFNLIKWPLEKYLNWKVNKILPQRIQQGIEEQLKKLSQRSEEETNEEQCGNCTMFDLSVRNAVLSNNLDPAPLPTSATSMLATFIKLTVTNATVSGLSRLRQSGNIDVRIDDCGSYAYLDLIITNLTIEFTTTVRTFWVDLGATVSATISARVIVEFVEKNATLFLETIIANTTTPIEVNVTPIGLASASIALFLPSSLIATALQVALQPLLNNTIQNGLIALHKFAHSEKISENKT